MPRRRWRPLAHRLPLTLELRRFLEAGTYRGADGALSFDMFLLRSHVLNGRFEDVRPLWDEHRAAIMGGWADAHPGTRPAAWWWFDAPEPRRVIRGADLQQPRPDRRGAASDAHRLYVERLWRRDFGIPSFQQVRPIGYVGLPAVEAQASYLDRLNLVGDDERAALTADDFRPEQIDPFLIDAAELRRLGIGPANSIPDRQGGNHVHK